MTNAKIPGIAARIKTAANTDDVMRRDLAFRLEKSDQPADQQQDDVGPQNLGCEIMHARRLP